MPFFWIKKRNQRSETHYLKQFLFPAEGMWGWQRLLCAALFLFLLGAGIYSGVQLQWRNSQYGQYQFIIDDQQLVFPVSTAKSDFLTTVRQDSEANQESSVSYSVENWNEVEEKTGIPLLTSALLQKQN